MKEVFLDHLAATHPRLLPRYRRLYPAGRANAPRADQERVSELVRIASGRSRRRPGTPGSAPPTPARVRAPAPQPEQLPLL